METRIKDQLHGSVGLQVSTDWLRACFDSLEQENQQATADLCMHQVLHSDLRLVVRDGDYSNNNNNNNNTPQLPQSVQQLGRLIQTSKNSTNHPLQETQADFQLLVQVEEIVDVSLNAEQRYNPQYYNKATRSLKLCLSHGYKSQQLPTIVAQEVTKIPNLQTDSLAGMKLLLHGKIRIRHGILMLNGGNTLVCGGSVEELVQVQRRSIERAKQRAGVGVDATIRALVNINQENLDDDGQPQDEAHEESGDVPMIQVPQVQVPQAQPQLHQHQHQPIAHPIPPPPIGQSPPNVIPPDNTPPRGPPQSAVRPFQAQQVTANFATTRRDPPRQAQTEQFRNSMSGSNNNNPYARNRRTSSGTSSPLSAAGPSNPYTSSKLSQGTTSSSSSAPASASAVPTNINNNNNISGSLPATRTKPVSGNPYSSSARNSRPEHADRPYNNNNEETAYSPALSSITHTPPRDRTTGTNHQQSSLSNTIFAPVQNRDVSLLATTPSRAQQQHQQQDDVDSLPIQNKSFDNLVSLLDRLVQNRQMYESYQKFVFRVPMKTVVRDNSDHYFNIAKNPEYKKSGNQPKHVYIINAKFGCDTDRRRFLACKFPPSLTEPCFGKSATELKALQKTNRGECDRIVTSGHAIAKARFLTNEYKLWNATLFQTADEIFADDSREQAFSLDNVKKPILLVKPDN